MNEIIIYQSNELSQHIEVRVEDETIWLTQSQIVLLFDSSKANISEHIKHIFQTGELSKEATVRNFRTVQDANYKWFAFSKLDMDANDILEKI